MQISDESGVRAVGSYIGQWCIIRGTFRDVHGVSCWVTAVDVEG